MAFPNIFRDRRRAQPRTREGQPIGGLNGMVASQQRQAQSFAQPTFGQPGMRSAPEAERPMVKPATEAPRREQKAAPQKAEATAKEARDLRPKPTFRPSPARNQAIARRIGQAAPRAPAPQAVRRGGLRRLGSA